MKKITLVIALLFILSNCFSGFAEDRISEIDNQILLLESEKESLMNQTVIKETEFPNTPLKDDIYNTELEVGDAKFYYPNEWTTNDTCDGLFLYPLESDEIGTTVMIGILENKVGYPITRDEANRCLSGFESGLSSSLDDYEWEYSTFLSLPATKSSFSMKNGQRYLGQGISFINGETITNVSYFIREDLKNIVQDYFTDFCNHAVLTKNDNRFVDESVTELYLLNRENRKYVYQCIKETRIPELKTALDDYRKNNACCPDIELLIEAIDLYGNYDGIVCENDYFSGDDTVYYDGYNEIDENHFIHPYLCNSKQCLEVGFIKEDWLFADNAKLKIIDSDGNKEYMSLHQPNGSKHDVLNGKTIKETITEDFLDSDIDYLLNDMSGQVTIRFEGDNGIYDYDLTDADKECLQNFAKFLKLYNTVDDIYSRYMTLEK